MSSPDFDEERETILAKAVALERSITQPKSIAVQVESCKAAVARTQKRVEVANQALDAATLDYEKAQVDLASPNQ